MTMFNGGIFTESACTSPARPRSPVYQSPCTTGGLLTDYSEGDPVLSGSHSSQNKSATIIAFGTDDLRMLPHPTEFKDDSGSDTSVQPSTFALRAVGLPSRVSSHLQPASSELPQGKASDPLSPSEPVPSFTKEEQIDILSRAYQISSNPTLEERRKLGQLVGRTLDQVTNWFKGQRRRLKRQAATDANLQASQNAVESRLPRLHDSPCRAWSSKSGVQLSDKIVQSQLRSPRDPGHSTPPIVPRPVHEGKRKRFTTSDHETEPGGPSRGNPEHHSESDSRREHTVVSVSTASATRSSVRLLARSLAQVDDSEDLTSLSTSQSPEPSSRPPQCAMSAPVSERMTCEPRHHGFGAWTAENREYLLRYARHVDSHPRPDVVAQLAEDTRLAISQVSAFFGKRSQESKLCYVGVNRGHDAASNESIESEDEGIEGLIYATSVSEQGLVQDCKQTPKMKIRRPHKRAKIQLPVQTTDSILPAPSISIGASPLTPTSPASIVSASQVSQVLQQHGVNPFNLHDPRVYLSPFIQMPQQTTGISPFMMNQMIGMNSLGLIGMHLDPGGQLSANGGMSSTHPLHNLPAFTPQQPTSNVGHAFVQPAPGPQLPNGGQFNPYLLATMQQQQQLPFSPNSVTSPTDGVAVPSCPTPPAAPVVNSSSEAVRKNHNLTPILSRMGDETIMSSVITSDTMGDSSGPHPQPTIAQVATSNIAPFTQPAHDAVLT